MSYKYK